MYIFLYTNMCAGGRTVTSYNVYQCKILKHVAECNLTVIVLSLILNVCTLFLISLHFSLF